MHEGEVGDGVAPAMCRPGPQGQAEGNIWRIWEEMNAPVGGDQVVDEDQHLELGQLVPGARVHAVPKWQERVRSRRHLHMQHVVVPQTTTEEEKKREAHQQHIYFQFLADTRASTSTTATTVRIETGYGTWNLEGSNLCGSWKYSGL